VTGHRDHNLTLPAIILAAGASRRMGSPKALLQIEGTTFLRHIADTLGSAGVDEIVVVLGAESDRIRKSMEWFRGTVAVNPRWEDGQLSSLVAGIDALKKGRSRGAMICPVDHPLITKKLLLDLITAFGTSKKKIVVPALGGRRGHPVIFDASLFDELRRAPADPGARAVIHSHAEDLAEIPTLERGALVDIATMQDYEKEILRGGASGG
jgi:molybdenum cofactor cytidylyltransferase